MVRSTRGRTLFYHRDSGGKHEMTPGEYVNWAANDSLKRGLAFDGSAGTIEHMIRNRECEHGDVYLDYDVRGHILSRPGLDALFARVERDKSVSHLHIVRRDRIARPNNPVDGVQLELRLRLEGVTLVYTNRECAPLSRLTRQDIGDLIGSIVEFDQAGKDCRDLAQKIIHAQIGLNRQGFTTGGRPPYAFRRWLVQDDGTRVRELIEGERVRMRGHHVVWLPVDEDHPEMITTLRIHALLRDMRAFQVARLLTSEGILTPDHNRTRRDNGIVHATSGVWHATTVTNIGRNRLLSAVCSYGRRAMGDHLRLSADGPRELKAEDLRHDQKPKVVQNPEGDIRRHPAHFDAIVPMDEHKSLVQILDARAGTQRGKPRCKDPSQNPLGCRAFDVDCGWPMYRAGGGDSFKYRCGLYMQSHGAECEHNPVDGPTAVRFALRVMQDDLLARRLKPKLLARLRQMAAAHAVQPVPVSNLRSLEVDLARTNTELEQIEKNLGLAKTEASLRAMERTQETLLTRKSEVQSQIQGLKDIAVPVIDPDAEVRSALAVLDQIEELSSDSTRTASVTTMFNLVNLRLAFKFEKRTTSKRATNVVRHCFVAFGEKPLPVKLYAGPTSRKALSEQRMIEAASSAANPGGDGPRPDGTSSGEEGNSLGNVSRGDRI